MLAMKNLKILMLEDVEDDAGLIDWTLKKEKLQFTRLRVDSRDGFVAALDEFDPDIVLSDHSLPQFNSIEALEVCKRKKPNIPFILVTGAVSEEFAVNCLKRGADDYILKSNLSRLPTAIEFAIRQHENEDRRRQQETQLVSQNQELVKINKELDSLVYSISHNIRSPLSSVLGVVNIARLDPVKEPEVVDHYFELIEGSVKKLDKTLREILNYSQNLRTEPELEEVQLGPLVDECMSKLSYIRGYDTIVKEVNIIQEVPFYSDSHRLSAILSNLISNALMFADLSKEKSMVRISVNVNPAFAEFVIADNGVGIAEQQLPNIFRMFFRASERSEGPGLGLYIAKEMVDRLRGSIHVESLRYEHTTVSLSIPNKVLTG